jgi:hypothetical protein
MYRIGGRSTRALKRAHDFAAIQVAKLCESHAVPRDEALPFVAREILRLNREGEHNAQRLANRAVSGLREHIQKRESALRVARPSDPD